ncbi:MAG: YbjN domain-containing protein [Salibacteraceae bacterium]
MKDNFIRVKKYLFELGYNVVGENETDGLLVIEDESLGIKNLVIGCMDPILIMEQIIFKVNNDNPEIYRELLKKNRDIVHGAFVLDEAGENVIFRDTLQIDNLDLNELEGSLTSLTLLLMEYSNEILEFSKN